MPEKQPTKVRDVDAMKYRTWRNLSHAPPICTSFCAVPPFPAWHTAEELGPINRWTRLRQRRSIPQARSLASFRLLLCRHNRLGPRTACPRSAYVVCSPSRTLRMNFSFMKKKIRIQNTTFTNIRANFSCMSTITFQCAMLIRRGRGGYKFTLAVCLHDYGWRVIK